MIKKQDERWFAFCDICGQNITRKSYDYEQDAQEDIYKSGIITRIIGGSPADICANCQKNGGWNDDDGGWNDDV